MRFRQVLCIVLLATLAACADQAPESGPGTLTATLKSPNGTEGAALVVLIGEGIGSVSAVGRTEVYSYAGPDATQVVLIDQAGGQLAFQVAVADTTLPPLVVIRQVAGPDDELRSILTGYDLELRR